MHACTYNYVLILTGDGRFSQTSFPVWHCETDFVNLTALCNGIDDCIGGTDESNPLCESELYYVIAIYWIFVACL